MFGYLGIGIFVYLMTIKRDATIKLMEQSTPFTAVMAALFFFTLWQVLTP